MNLFSDSHFYLGYSAALDAAFSIPKTSTLTIWLSEPTVRPSREAIADLLSSVDNDTSLIFEVGVKPNFQLTTDCLLMDSGGLIRDVCCGAEQVSLAHVRQVLLSSLVPLPTIDAAYRAISIVARYPGLPVADDFRAWLHMTNRYLQRSESRFPELALQRLRFE